MTLLAPTVAAVSGGLFSCAGHRGAYVAARKAEGAYRIVIVGDSMAYGQGLPHQRTLSQRLAAHLNVALPDWHVEGISLGLCGACLFHALGRAEHQALTLDPDAVVVAVCCNDANMLRPQPPTNEGIGQTWISFRPHIETALTTFAARMRDRGVGRVAVLYFDRNPSYGSVSPALVLRDVCAAAGLPFIDASEALCSYPYPSITVSIADGHLNATAHEIVARLLARFVQEQRWLPPSLPLGEAGWLEHMAALPERLASTGVPRLVCGARALAALDTKWLDRRNRSRASLSNVHESVRSAIVRAQRAGLERMLWSAAGRWIRVRHNPDVLNGEQIRLHELDTIGWALEHAAQTGSVGQRLEDLSRLIRDGEEDRPERLVETADDIAARAERDLAALDEAAASIPAPRDEDDVDITFARFAIGRVQQAVDGLRQSARRMREIGTRLPACSSRDIDRLAGYADRTLGEIAGRLRFWTEQLPWRSIGRAARDWVIASPVMTLDLVIAADPGPEMWQVYVSADGWYPAYQASDLHIANLVRDGQPHAYQIDVPFFLLGDINVRLTGSFGADAEAGGLRMYPAALQAHGRTRRLARLVYRDRSNESVSFSYPSVFLLEEESA